MECSLLQVNNMLQFIRYRISEQVRSARNPNGVLPPSAEQEYHECLEIAGYDRLLALFNRDESKLKSVVQIAKDEQISQFIDT